MHRKPVCTGTKGKRDRISRAVPVLAKFFE
jgi:hypothetical protein